MKLLKKGIAMNFSKKTFFVAGLAAAVALAGCSSDNPDEGTNISKTPISGTAVDGYIAGATVYVDNNNNGRKNAGESTAITDKDGYFSTAKDGTDYCADDATAIQKLHCLKASGLETGSVVRTFGGYDLFTGEPFEGSLAARITLGSDGVVANQMISPLTSIMVDVPADSQQAVLDAFGLGASDLEADFLDSSGFSQNIVNSAIKLHKVVTLLSEVFSETYDAFGEERSFPETPNAIIYKALAEAIEAETALNSTSISAAFTAAQQAIEALYDKDEDLTFPGNANGTAAISNAGNILAVVDGAIPGGTLLAEAKSRVIGVETVVKKMIDEDADVAGAITEASNPFSGMYTAIDSALSGGDVDFTALTKVNYSAPTYNDVAVVGGDSFADLANKQLFVSFADGGESGSGYFFFNSEQGATGGELKVCLRYDDGVAGVPEFEETDGVLLKGSWLSIDDSKLILNLAGSLNLSLTDKGTNSDDKKRYSLSYGGETRSWLSDDGLLDDVSSGSVTDQPTSDATCKTLLESNDIR